MKFEVLCDNKGSYQIALSNDAAYQPEYGKAAVLVRCDRTDNEDNERGLQLATKIADFLNTLPEQEREDLVSLDMVPMKRG